MKGTGKDDRIAYHVEHHFFSLEVRVVPTNTLKLVSMLDQERTDIS